MITIDYITKLLDQQSKRCSITGIELVHGCYPILSSMSIDRIDNGIGHTTDNIQLTSLGANLAKNKASNDDIKYAIGCIRGTETFTPGKLSRDYISCCRRNLHMRDPNNLTTDFLVGLYYHQNGKCAITGINLAGYRHPCLSLSIDRINLELPHNQNNVRLVTKCINLARRHYSEGVINDWITRVRETI